MKSLLLALAIISGAAVANAQAPRTHIMRDGETRYVYDTQSNQYMNLVCEAAPIPMPIPVPPPRPRPEPIPIPIPIPNPRPDAKVCELRFNPVGDSCSKYRVYINGLQASECMSTLATAVQTVNSMRNAGLCRVHKASSPCDLRFNPTGDSCSKYRVYINGKQSSECLADLNLAEMTVIELRRANLCY